MDLRKRLARLERSAAPKAPPRGPDPPRHAFPADLSVTMEEGPAGPVWVRDEVHPIARPGHAPGVLAAGLTRPVPPGLAWGDVLLLDTETTGLAGGTGTVPFLVGVAWWEDGDLRCRQFLLPGPGAEPAMLAALEALAARFPLIAAFNGHSYDLPLLRTRGILARRRGLLADHATWDLLPLARRLWGRRLPDCRQGTVERLVLESVRPAGDIPGARIPQAWIDFVKDGDAADLGAVVLHNVLDLVGMAGILGCGATACAERGLGPAGSSARDWRDAWSLARLSEAIRDRQREADWIRAAVADAPDAGAVPAPFLADAVRLVKRTGDWDLVASLLRRALAALPDESWPHREAAILHEHRLRDLPRALEHARLCGEPDRVERLERRLSS